MAKRHFVIASALLVAIVLAYVVVPRGEEFIAYDLVISDDFRYSFEYRFMFSGKYELLLGVKDAPFGEESIIDANSLDSCLNSNAMSVELLSVQGMRRTVYDLSGKFNRRSGKKDDSHGYTFFCFYVFEVPFDFERGKIDLSLKLGEIASSCPIAKSQFAIKLRPASYKNSASTYSRYIKTYNYEEFSDKFIRNDVAGKGPE